MPKTVIIAGPNGRILLRPGIAGAGDDKGAPGRFHRVIRGLRHIMPVNIMRFGMQIVFIVAGKNEVIGQRTGK